jgi:uncharacterized protein (TIGR02453 family)
MKSFDMKYFGQEMLSFLENLPNNNNKEWFNAKKVIYKKEVEAPFKIFISDMITGLQPYIPELSIDVKDCIFRIYKDLRFSKDKTPYKNYVSAVISKNGRKDRTNPGAYIQLSGEDVRLYSGCFALDPKQREKIRVSIYKNMDRFNLIIRNSGFVKTFGEIQGEKYKKIPSLYFESAEIQPLLLNKSFHYFKRYQAKLLLSSELLDTLVNDFSHTVKINEFLREALK